MSSSNIKIKDPTAVLDYSIDWSKWLKSGDSITMSTWTVPAGITKGSDLFTNDMTTVWLSGGANGLRYIVTNHITTAQGREDDRSLIIVCKEL